MNLNYFLDFLQINFLMWPTKKIKIKKKPSQRHIGGFGELDGEGCIPEKNIFTEVKNTINSKRFKSLTI